MNDATENALRTWLERRLPDWRRLATQLHDITRTRTASPRDAFDLAEGYRTVARDLSMARRLIPGSRTRQTLETLYADLHAMLYRPAHRMRTDLLRMLRIEVPAATRELRTHLAAVVALFLLAAAGAAWLITTYPDLVGLLMDEHTISQVERGELWTDNIFSVVPPSILSVHLLANNIMVSITALCAGVFFGLGTFYIIALNGALLGAVFAFTAQHGLAMRLLEFVVAHGLVELSVICLAGAAGSSIGEALIRPGARSRSEAFQQASGRAMKLMAVCALLLIGCGFIEGYISPDSTYPLASRVVIGVSYWLLMITVLSGDLFGRRRTRAAAAGSAIPAASR